MKKRYAGLMLAAAAAAVSVTTGCATTAFENAEAYFQEVAEVTATWFSNSSDSGSGSDETEEGSGNELDAPGDFTLDEDGNYSFTGVENADYYLMYFCEPDAVDDGDAFLFSSNTLDAVGDGGETYTGNVDDLLQYGYGEYLVKVFAFPNVNDSEHTMSTAATATFVCSGAQDAPVIDYLWNTFDDTVDVQLTNVDDYTYQYYPDYVEITFTNTEDESDVVILTMEDISTDSYSLVSDELTRGTSYNITAVSYSESDYVTNQVSDTTTVAEGVVFGDSNVMSDNYYYTDGIARNSFSYLQVCENFDLANGGAMNEPGTSVTFTFTATPTEAAEGSAYSYIVAGDCMPFSFEDGTLDLYEDGTLLMTQNSEMPPEGPSSIQGIWIDNGDGTATLSFDHSTLVTSVD